MKKEEKSGKRGAVSGKSVFKEPRVFRKGARRIFSRRTSSLYRIPLKKEKRSLTSQQGNGHKKGKSAVIKAGTNCPLRKSELETAPKSNKTSSNRLKKR